MFDPQNPATLVSLEATVYDATGEKVGKIAEINHQDEYMLMEKGWLFHKDFYVPLSAVSHVDEDGAAHLNLNRHDLEQGPYDIPPINIANISGTQANTVDPGMNIGTDSRAPVAGMGDDVFSKQSSVSPDTGEEDAPWKRTQDIGEHELKGEATADDRQAGDATRSQPTYAEGADDDTYFGSDAGPAGRR
jgi:hypothetical protein